MKASNFFIHTIKDNSINIKTTSHRLMTKASIIRRVASGIYDYLPLGLRSIRKIEKIIRKEMNSIGAIELLMPLIQPSKLWEESGRLYKYGKELVCFKDRKKSNFIIAPTHEEEVTDIARNFLKSYKSMPITFYQIQTKFRDEIRPRFGIIRSREFIMKDAYSFDKNIEDLHKSYQKMFDSYTKIFNIIGLNFRSVIANNNEIHGFNSHEFHAICNIGEDNIAYCPTSNFAANIEVIESFSIIPKRNIPLEIMKKINKKDLEKNKNIKITESIEYKNIIKSIIAVTKNQDNEILIWVLMIQYDHEINETKVRSIKGLSNFRFATDIEILNWFGVSAEYVGPIINKKNIYIIVDRTAANMSDFIIGANEENFFFTGVNWERDLSISLVADIRNAKKNDPSPDGMGFLKICRGIEIGHLFQLRNKYSKLMNATFLDKIGKQQQIMMGCYGIGVTRILSAVVEQNFDEKGIVWPEIISPFQIVLCPIGYHFNDRIKQYSDNLYYKIISHGIDIILDDRKIRPGESFVEWDLIGVTHRIIINENTLKTKNIEYKNRNNTTSIMLSTEDILEKLINK